MQISILTCPQIIETSARNMSFNLFMQALWPEVQQKIFEEVSRVLPEDASEVTDYRDVMSKLVSLSSINFTKSSADLR